MRLEVSNCCEAALGGAKALSSRNSPVEQHMVARERSHRAASSVRNSLNDQGSQPQIRGTRCKVRLQRFAGKFKPQLQIRTSL